MFDLSVGEKNSVKRENILHNWAENLSTCTFPDYKRLARDNENKETKWEKYSF